MRRLPRDLKISDEFITKLKSVFRNQVERDYFVSKASWELLRAPEFMGSPISKKSRLRKIQVYEENGQRYIDVYFAFDRRFVYLLDADFS